MPCCALHPPRWLALQLVLEAEPLESGRSADATGRLVVTRREGWSRGGLEQPEQCATAAPVTGAAAGGGAPGSWLLSYKLSETGVTHSQQIKI